MPVGALVAEEYNYNLCDMEALNRDHTIVSKASNVIKYFIDCRKPSKLKQAIERKVKTHDLRVMELKHVKGSEREKKSQTFETFDNRFHLPALCSAKSVRLKLGQLWSAK